MVMVGGIGEKIQYALVDHAFGDEIDAKAREKLIREYIRENPKAISASNLISITSIAGGIIGVCIGLHSSKGLIKMQQVVTTAVIGGMGVVSGKITGLLVVKFKTGLGNTDIVNATFRFVRMFIAEKIREKK